MMNNIHVINKYFICVHNYIIKIFVDKFFFSINRYEYDILHSRMIIIIILSNTYDNILICFFR